MGLCSFLFNMYKLTANINHYDLAQNFLRIACFSIKRNSKVNITDGLFGIGFLTMFFALLILTLATGCSDEKENLDVYTAKIAQVDQSDGVVAVLFTIPSNAPKEIVEGLETRAGLAMLFSKKALKGAEINRGDVITFKILAAYPRTGIQIGVWAFDADIFLISINR